MSENSTPPEINAPEDTWRSIFPGRGLLGERFEKSQEVEHQLIWTSANPKTTDTLIKKLGAADVNYRYDPEQIKPDHAIYTITIEGEDDLRKVAKAGGDFAGKIYYELADNFPDAVKSL